MAKRNDISIHVLRVEDDIFDTKVNGKTVPFQSTSSVWRTTRGRRISITGFRDFNPRPPCGGRPSYVILFHPLPAFQSTSSVWRTTPLTEADARKWAISIHVLRVEDDETGHAVAMSIPISIHVLRVEDDRPVGVHRDQQADFNPRPPCGGRRHPRVYVAAYPHFNPRPPCGGRPAPRARHYLRRNFNPRPPCGGRLMISGAGNFPVRFQSTSSVWRTTRSQAFRSS